MLFDLERSGVWRECRLMLLLFVTADSGKVKSGDMNVGEWMVLLVAAGLMSSCCVESRSGVH